MVAFGATFIELFLFFFLCRESNLYDSSNPTRERSDRNFLIFVEIFGENLVFGEYRGKTSPQKIYFYRFARKIPQTLILPSGSIHMCPTHINFWFKRFIRVIRVLRVNDF